MDFEQLFQLTASIIASILCGSSLALWLLTTQTTGWKRLKDEPLIAAQAVIGAFILLGSIVSILLSIAEADPKISLPSSMPQLEINIVLVLLAINEYLSISTLQHWVTHAVFTMLSMGAVAILSLSIPFQEQRRILLSSFMVIAFAGLSFIYVQIITAWVRCARQWYMDASLFKLFWHSPSPQATREQRALWIASIFSLGSFLISLGLTIFACVQTNLQTEIVTLQVAITSLRKLVVSSYILPSVEHTKGISDVETKTEICPYEDNLEGPA